MLLYPSKYRQMGPTPAAVSGHSFVAANSLSGSAAGRAAWSSPI
ncbi:hypothetical protein [Prochlorococcus marinus]|nr:hypothetical protein [Prochlorococcus marinus]